MKREVFIWIGMFLVVLAVALYIRFYSEGQISVVTAFAHNSSSYQNVYPYQRLVLDAYINNTGSGMISDIGVEELINGNVINVYGVTVPPDKTATIPINYTPTQGGRYNISIIVDPAKRYNIGDRNNAAASLELTINNPQKPQAYSLLPPGSAVSHGNVNLNTVGFLYYSYLSAGYNITQFNITGMPGLNDFLTPLIDVVGGYVENMSVAHAKYANGNVVYSIWLRGYVLPDIMAVGAQGRNLTTQNSTVGGSQVTLVHLKDNESLCSWYSNGWIKTVTAQGNTACLGYIQNNYSEFAPQTIPKVNVPALSIGVIIANDSFVEGNSLSTGYTVLIGNQSLVYSGVATNSAESGSCYGIIDTANGISYCSSYIFSTNQIVGPTSLIRTTAAIGGLNATALAVVNTSKALQQVPLSIDILKVSNLSGQSVQFVNGVKPSCGITGFGCQNASYNNGTLSFRLLNANITSVRLGSIGCVLNGVPKYTLLNKTLPGLGIVNITTQCYNEGQLAQSLPYGYVFGLRMNYTNGNTIHNATGTVYVLG